MSCLNRIKKVILATILVVLLCPLSLVYASDYHGIYEVDDSVVTSLEVIVIDKNIFEVIIGGSDNDEEAYPDIISNLYTIINNSDSLFGTVDPNNNEEKRISINDPYAKVIFAEGKYFPAFNVQVFNPKYSVNNDILQVKFKNKVIAEFALTEDGQLEDLEEGKLNIAE